MYTLLKGYKMNVRGIIEGSIRGYHLSKKKRTNPSPMNNQQTMHPSWGKRIMG